VTAQDILILKWLARALCDYHKRDKVFAEDCGFCTTNFKALQDAFEYGKQGTIPFELATQLINGE